MRIRAQAEHDGDYGDEVGVELGVRNGLEPALEDAGDDGLADPAEGETAEGDAELDGGEEFVKVFLEAADGAGSEDILGDEMLDASLANADEGEFGRHKEAALAKRMSKRYRDGPERGAGRSLF